MKGRLCGRDRRDCRGEKLRGATFREKVGGLSNPGEDPLPSAPSGGTSLPIVRATSSTFHRAGRLRRWGTTKTRPGRNKRHRWWRKNK